LDAARIGDAIEAHDLIKGHPETPRNAVERVPGFDRIGRKGTIGFRSGADDEYLPDLDGIRRQPIPFLQLGYGHIEPPCDAIQGVSGLDDVRGRE